MKPILVLLCALAATTAVAQDYPAKPVRIVVGFSASSTTDILARSTPGQLSFLRRASAGTTS